MARRSRTSEKVGAYREVLGTFDALRTFTHISPQRLSAIAQGSKTTASERARIAAFDRRMQEGNVSYSVQEAARRRGVGLNELGRQLQDVGKGTFTPAARLNLLQLANVFGVDLGQVQFLSMERIRKADGTFVGPRGISEAYVDKEGRVVAYGSDGQKYAAYTVTNRQTDERRFFWGRFDAIGYMTSAEFADSYFDDPGTYDVAIADVWGMEVD